MNIKMAASVKDLFRMQHRLKPLLEQILRYSSNESGGGGSGIIPRQNPMQNDTDFQITKTIDTQYTNTIFEPVKHDDDVSQQFTASQLIVRLATPQQLQTKPDEDDLPFGKNFTDHMLKIYYHRSLGGWQRPEITPLENLVLHPASKVLHYALELFEGMKAFRGVDDKIRLFRPEMNMHRMNVTAKRAGLPTFESMEFIKCLSRLLSIDSEWAPRMVGSSLYIRPTFIGIDPTLGVAASDSALLYTLLSPVGSYFKPGSGDAVSLLADPQYTRAWPGGVGNRKMGSNYAPTLKVQKDAIKKGLQMVLWLYGEDHQLTEVGIMNIFMVYINDDGEKELITPPLNSLILPGINRDSVLTLARQWNKFKVREATFTMPQVCELLNQGRLLELFGTGTACTVCPINRINYMGNDLYIPSLEQENPVYALVRDTLFDIQYGKIKHPWAMVID